jgi:hypothetical protein
LNLQGGHPQMTFALLRAGLPNSVVAAALAFVPLMAIALAPVQRAAPVQDAVVAAGSQSGASGDQAVAD